MHRLFTKKLPRSVLALATKLMMALLQRSHAYIGTPLSAIDMRIYVYTDMYLYHPFLPPLLPSCPPPISLSLFLSLCVYVCVYILPFPPYKYLITPHFDCNLSFRRWQRNERSAFKPLAVVGSQ